MLKSIAKAAAKSRRKRADEDKKRHPHSVVDPWTGRVAVTTPFSAEDEQTHSGYDASTDDDQYTPYDHRDEHHKH